MLEISYRIQYIAEAFLQVLLEILVSFIRDKFVSLFDFEKEYEKLSSEFSHNSNCVSRCLKKQLKDKTIENWLQKLNLWPMKLMTYWEDVKMRKLNSSNLDLCFYHPGIINFHHKIVKMMKDIMEKLDAIAEERSKFHLPENIIERQATSTHETGVTTN